MVRPADAADTLASIDQAQVERTARGLDHARRRKDKLQLQQEAERGARMFETVLAKQMFSAMRKTLPEGSALRDGSGPGGHLYMQFVDDAVSSQLGAAGLGLRDMLIKAFGGDPSLAGRSHTAPAHQMSDPGAAGAVPGPLREDVGPGAALPGATGLLQKTANQLLDQGGRQRFSKAGRLSERDLASPLRTRNDDGVATFNATAADGYKGHSKCNLFALEAARRAGYAVPVVARNRGWGFPSADRLATDAADGTLKGGWAQVATGTPASELDREITSGRSAFLLVGSADGARHGHMAVVERIRALEYGPDGEVRRIIFDGYEARDKGAMRLEGRTWNLKGNPGIRGARNGFSGIELLRLRRAERVGASEVKLSERAPSTEKALFVSSDSIGRPMSDLEGKP